MSQPTATTRFTAYATLIHNAIGHPAATHYFTAYAPLIHSRLQFLVISMSYLVASPLHLHSLALLPHILQSHTQPTSPLADHSALLARIFNTSAVNTDSKFYRSGKYTVFFEAVSVVLHYTAVIVILIHSHLRYTILQRPN